MGKTLSVSVDGYICCLNSNYKNLFPSQDSVKVYVSDPWYSASIAEIGEISYTNADPLLLTEENKTIIYGSHKKEQNTNLSDNSE